MGETSASAAALRAAAARGEFQIELVERLLRQLPSLARLRGRTPHWQDLLPLPDGALPGRILVGCAASATADALARTLVEEGHTVEVLESTAAIRSTLKSACPDLVLVDADLPDDGGIELSREIKSRPETSFVPVVLVALRQDLDRRLRDARVDADDFLFLPINRLELKARVRSLLRLRLYFKDLEEHHSVILSLASALEAKDPYTRGHSERVGVLAAQLGRTLGIAEEECRILRTAGQLHDVGKIGMPERLLNKQGRLDDSEFETVMLHPTLGERICQPLRTMRAVLPLIRHHHERCDGSGYPDGLRDDSLLMGARILGLADAFDALTSARSYRRNYSTAEAMSILATETDEGRWDRRVFAALVALVRRG